jgi:acyl-CoA dehydrogenase
MGRKLINDAMDVMGGAGISRGPKNLLAHSYIATPISITVEGANILTRCLIVFGQGAIRAHPYALKEVQAAERGDVAAFDRAFWGHIGHIIRNKLLAVGYTLTRGYLHKPFSSAPEAKYERKLLWTSSVFAVLADMAMALFGGSLKVRERVTGRFADIFAWMYIASGILRKFKADGSPKEDLPYFEWSMKYCFREIQGALINLLSNFRAPLIGVLVRGPVKWTFMMNPIGSVSDDRDDQKLASLFLKNSPQRLRLFGGIYDGSKSSKKEHLRELEEAFALVKQSEAVQKKVYAALHEKKLKKQPAQALYQSALAAGIISQTEHALLKKAEEAALDVIQVDAFPVNLEAIKQAIS